MNPTSIDTIEFEGWQGCLRLHNDVADVVVTTTFGPHVMRYGLLNGPNAFQIIPETRGQTGGDKWLPYGGHRLWIAPEAMPRSYAPVNGPVGSVTQAGGTVTITNPAEPTTGIAKGMRVTLAPDSAAVQVVHQLTNHNVWPVTLAAWGLSIVANGGYAVLPQEPFVSHDDELAPARPLVLWKFTDMADPRWRWGTKYLSLHQSDTPTDKPQKVGAYNAQGWAAHITPSQALIVHIDVAPGGPSALTDQGSNFETYTDGPFQELETLGPLVTLEPGESLEHVESWLLAPADAIADDDTALDTALLPLVAQLRQAMQHTF